MLYVRCYLLLATCYLLIVTCHLLLATLIIIWYLQSDSFYDTGLSEASYFLQKKLFPFAPVVRLTILAEQRAIAPINWVEFCQKSIIGTAR